MFTGGFGLHYGIEKDGATIVPMSSGNTQKQLMLMQDFGTTALVATPSYAMYLSEMIKEKEIPRENFKLKYGFFRFRSYEREDERKTGRFDGYFGYFQLWLNRSYGTGRFGRMYI